MDYINIYDLRCENTVNPLGIDTNEPKFSYKLFYQEKTLPENRYQKAYRIIVSEYESNITENIGETWDSGWVYSSMQNHIKYSGVDINPCTRYYWAIAIEWLDGVKTKFSLPAYFETGLQDTRFCDDWLRNPENSNNPIFRTTKFIEEEVESARAYVCGMGFYEFYLNGKRAKKYFYAPSWTDYDERNYSKMLYPYKGKTKHRTLYNTIDITENLVKGKNVFVFILCNGWYNQTDKTIEGKLDYGKPKLFAKIIIKTKSGKVIVIDSNESHNFKTMAGPTVYDNIYYGEIYDANKEINDLHMPDLDISNWDYAINAKAPAGKLLGQYTNFDTVQELLHPTSIRKLEENKYLIDFGKNFSGNIKVRICLKKNQKLKIRFAEEIYEDGNLDPTSTCYGMPEQVQKYEYISNDHESKIWVGPEWYWLVYRYAEITYDGTLNYEDIKAEHIHIDCQETTFFKSSKELLNKLFEACKLTQVGSIHCAVPTDCPHRERMGYNGDAQFASESAMINFDLLNLYSKWAEDIKDAQDKTTGFVPHTAPFYGGGGGYGWGSAIAIIPFLIYRNYGDASVLEKAYKNIIEFINYATNNKNDKGLIFREEEGSWCLGDWSGITELGVLEQMIDVEFVNTFYYGTCCEIALKAAKMFGFDDDISWLELHAKNVSQTLYEEYYNKTTGHYGKGLYGYDVLAASLDFCVVDKNELMANLAKLIKGIDYTTDTGIVTYRYYFEALSEYGQVETAYKVFSNPSFPGMLYMIVNGATTIWENWNKSISSLYHPAYTSAGTFVSKYLGGLRNDISGAGFYNVIINPYIPDDFETLEFQQDTLIGKYMISYKKDNNYVYLDILIPANVRARFIEPEGYELKIGDEILYPGMSKLLLCKR